MNITLPNKVFSAVYSAKTYAVIKNNVLEISGNIDFDKLMIQMAYAIHGKKKCHYCNRSVSPKRITIDHCFPRDFGGPTIVDNLIPSCPTCNNRKSNLNMYEFSILRQMDNKSQAQSFFRRTVSKKYMRKYNVNDKSWFDLPRKWVEYRQLSEIILSREIGEIRGKKYAKTLEFAMTYNKLIRPIIISGNNVVIAELSSYIVAKEMGFRKVPVIRLENVIVVL